MSEYLQILSEELSDAPVRRPFDLPPSAMGWDEVDVYFAFAAHGACASQAGDISQRAWDKSRNPPQTPEEAAVVS